MLDHLYWANHRILSKLDSLDSLEMEISRLFHHVIYAERVWLTRLEGKDSSHLPIWVDADISDMQELIRENEQHYRRYISLLKEEQLNDLITYKNQSGTPFRTSIRDILTHVALHGQYHRGQINRALREESHEAVNVDYITYVRTTNP
nr:MULTISPECIES: DinB family protein [unclassified Paenibacillus]